ncbi:MAG TPA: LEA type 2 family protein [bacterium]|nr:LEA type 2 family protein [bacterium]
MGPPKPPPSRKFSAVLIATLCAAAPLLSCGPKVIQPTVAIAGLKSWVFGDEKSTLVFAAEVTNPNAFGGNLVGADYELEINGVAVGSGSLDSTYAIPPADTVRVLLPFALDHRALLNIILAGNVENLCYTLRGTARLETAFGVLERSFEKEARADLRQLLENAIR